MLSDREISAVVDRLWGLSGSPDANDVLAADAVVYDNRSGAVTIGVAALNALLPCLGELRGMRFSERHRLAGVDGEACVFVGDVGREGMPLAGAAGLLLVRDGRISRCEMWFRPWPPHAGVNTEARNGT